MSKVRTQIRPEPYGENACREFKRHQMLYLIAKHEGGDFLLRIEYIYEERLVEGAVDIIYNTLAKAGLVHD